MSVLVVPPLEEDPWPTLGPQVCEDIEENLVFGPGDMKGMPAKIDPETRALIYRSYQVYPKGTRSAGGQLIEGRRRFKRVAWSLQKGSAKTEKAAWLAIVELWHRGRVRCVGFDAAGQPIGGPVTDPYIPLVAYTEEQSEDLAYGAVLAILGESSCRISDDFDLGLERILRIGNGRKADGKAVAMANAPDARDGARTTFQHFDETHRFILPRLVKAHRTMLANIPKRMAADAWSLETTTAPGPGEGSVAEKTMDHALEIAAGKVENPRLFFFHRQAREDAPWDTREQVRENIVEAAGPTAEWKDIDNIVDQFLAPDADLTYLRRVYGNQLVRSADRAFNLARWKELARKDYEPEDGAWITLGFDGARRFDSTAIIGTEVLTGFQWVVGLWERPAVQDPTRPWEVPADEVDQAMAAAFERWRVWRLNADPPYWETTVDKWLGDHDPEGEGRVVAFRTNQWRKMSEACRAYANAIVDGSVGHGGDPRFTAHLGNAFRRTLQMRDEDQQPLWVIQKERPDSPMKIDAGVAAVLSWDARRDAVAENVGLDEDSVYELRSASNRALRDKGAEGPPQELIDSW
jgi:hypothetical protein